MRIPPKISAKLKKLEDAFNIGSRPEDFPGKEQIRNLAEVNEGDLLWIYKSDKVVLYYLQRRENIEISESKRNGLSSFPYYGARFVLKFVEGRYEFSLVHELTSILFANPKSRIYRLT